MNDSELLTLYKCALIEATESFLVECEEGGDWDNWNALPVKDRAMRIKERMDDFVRHAYHVQKYTEWSALYE